MTVRMSEDNGRTWPFGRSVHAGGSAYSCLSATPDGRILLLYEKIHRKPTGEPSNDRGWMNLSLAEFTIDWITG